MIFINHFAPLSNHYIRLIEYYKRKLCSKQGGRRFALIETIKKEPNMRSLFWNKLKKFRPLLNDGVYKIMENIYFIIALPCSHESFSH